MTLYKFDGKTQGGEEACKCSYPIGLDPYRSGCGNDCLYCYVKQRCQDIGNWNPNNPSSLDVEHFRKICNDAFNKSMFNSRAKQILTKKIPLRIGMNTDPFQVIEKERKVTKRLLEILKKYEYPYLLLTKNSMVADDEYIKLYDPSFSYLQITITSLNSEMSKKIEQNASSPEDRLKALERLVDIGLKPAVRINPLFPIFPDGYFTDDITHKESLPPLEMFSWELVERICEKGPSTLIAGFLRVDSIKSHNWFMGRDIDLRPYFCKDKSNKHYSKEEVEYYYKEVKKICDKHGVAFTVCYDDDKKYEHFKPMWANQDDCCNALNRVPCFKTIYKKEVVQ